MLLEKNIPITSSRSGLRTTEIESLGGAQYVCFVLVWFLMSWRLFFFFFFLVYGADNLLSRVLGGEKTGLLKIGPFEALLNFSVSLIFKELKILHIVFARKSAMKDSVFLWETFSSLNEKINSLLTLLKGLLIEEVHSSLKARGQFPLIIKPSGEK